MPLQREGAGVLPAPSPRIAVGTPDPFLPRGFWLLWFAVVVSLGLSLLLVSVSTPAAAATVSIGSVIAEDPTPSPSPSPTVEPSPSPSPTPTEPAPTGSALPSVGPTQVVLDDEQFATFVFVGGFLLFLSTASLFASWSRR